MQKAVAGDVLYEDDFTNLDPSWGTPGDILSVKEGKLVLKPALNTTQSVLNQSNVFDDADIQVEVTLSAGDPIVAGGLIFWAKDYTNFYCLCIDANGSFKISHFVTDRWLNPVGWTESDAINKGVGQVNKLRIVTKGRQATAFINDKQVITTNGQPPQGEDALAFPAGQRRIHKTLGSSPICESSPPLRRSPDPQFRQFLGRVGKSPCDCMVPIRLARNWSQPFAKTS